MTYTYQQALNVIEAIETEFYEPNEWEVKFMEDVTLRGSDLTQKQAGCLLGIYAKATGGGRFQKKEYFRR